MGKGFLSLATATILNAVSNGYSFGFDIVDITGMPGGTVYPALRRLEEAGYPHARSGRRSASPRPSCGRAAGTTKSRAAGRQALAEAVKRYRLLDQAQLTSMREPKSSRA